jgi:hydroxyacylglutathione hydrolase
MIAASVMDLTALPAFTDNTIWNIDDDANAIVVDPGEPESVAEVLDARRLDLAAILVTVGREVRHSAEALDRMFERLDIPAHTAGHIAYPSRDGAGEPIVLCGANLLPAGGGTLFERTAEQMHCSFR